MALPRLSRSTISLHAALLLALPALSAAHAATLSIPQSHPRIWYSAQSGTPGAARLARARAYRSTNPVPINNWDPASRSRDRALVSLLGNSPEGCNDAISWIRGYNFPSQNEARWSGEQAILVFDWCYQHMSASDRSTITANWNARLAELNAASWGGVNMSASNYHWGFLRNSLLWGIASYHHNAQAQSFIDHALDVRYRNLASNPPSGHSRFQAWYEGFGIGGVPLEGSAYGGAMMYYPAIAFTAATDFGYDAWNAVGFHHDSLYYLHYASTPQPTQRFDNSVPHWQLFPFNEDENFREGGVAETDAYADFITAYALRHPGSRVSGMARGWMEQRGLAPSWWMRSELASAAITGQQPALPLDYYADGAQFLYGASAPAAGATRFHLQLGGSGDGVAGGGVGHVHRDLGNFQIWRKGRWITRETTGYVNPIAGWRNSGTVDVGEAVGHNTVLFEGRGQIGSYRDWARVKRLQSAPGFSFAAVDMTPSYRAPANETWEARRDWPFAEVAIREFVYLRELEALVVLDRVKSGSDSLQPVYDHEYTGPRMAGDQVRKTFVLHATGTGSSGTGNPFTLGNASATARVGTQRMDLRTLLPASPAYRVVNEGGPVGQFRIEYDVSGSEMSYLLNVVGARDAAEAPVSVSMDDLGDSWRLQLTQPGKGSATVVLRKGEASNGGSVRIGNGPVQSLRSDVQGMLLTADGPVWTGGGTQGSGGISTGGNQRPAELPARSGGAGVDPQPVATGTLAPLATAGSDEGGARGTAGPLHGFQARIVRLHGAIIESWRRGLALLRALAGLEAQVAPGRTSGDHPTDGGVVQGHEHVRRTTLPGPPRRQADPGRPAAGSGAGPAYSPSQRSTPLHQTVMRNQASAQNVR